MHSALPPAQSGRRSSSSGRAVATTRSGTPLNAADELVDEVEKRVVRPVQVLEDEHERTLVRERLEEVPPGGECLAPALGR